MKPVVVVTGATRGIGRAGAVELGRRGAEVIVVGRDAERVSETVAEVGGRAVGYPADLERMDEVRRLAATLLENHERIDVLANNAGAIFSSRQVTQDGFERSFALNHLAPFLLTNLLLARLSESPLGGRVVTTSSDAHGAAALDFEDLQTERASYRSMRVYGTTKLCNILMTKGLAKRASGIHANCFHPGVVRTGFGKNDGPLLKLPLMLIGPFLRTPAKGARTLVHLSLDDAGGTLNGEYLVDDKVKQPSGIARDESVADGLWERSAALVGLG